MTAVDEVYVEQNKSGTVLKQIARVRVFFISFLSGKLIKQYDWFQSESDFNKYKNIKVTNILLGIDSLLTLILTFLH